METITVATKQEIKEMIEAWSADIESRLTWELMEDDKPTSFEELMEAAGLIAFAEAAGSTSLDFYLGLAIAHIEKDDWRLAASAMMSAIDEAENIRVPIGWDDGDGDPAKIYAGLVIRRARKQVMDDLVEAINKCYY